MELRSASNMLDMALLKEQCTKETINALEV